MAAAASGGSAGAAAHGPPAAQKLSHRDLWQTGEHKALGGLEHAAAAMPGDMGGH